MGEWIGRVRELHASSSGPLCVAILVWTAAAARRASSNQRNINGITTNELPSTYRGKPIDRKGFFKNKDDYNNMNTDERKSYFNTKKWRR